MTTNLVLRTGAAAAVLALAGAASAGGATSAPPTAAPPPPAPKIAAHPSAPGAPAPHLQFEATTVDLGDVVRGQDASAVFTYRNTGDGELRILSAKPG